MLTNSQILIERKVTQDCVIRRLPLRTLLLVSQLNHREDHVVFRYAGKVPAMADPVAAVKS